MTAQRNTRLDAIFVGFARGASGVVIFAGILTLIGWNCSIDVLKTWHRVPVSAMNPMTAFALILGGVSLTLVVAEPKLGSRRRLVSKLCAAAMVAIGALKFLSYSFSIPIDILFFPARSLNNPIAPNTAAAMLTAGLGLLFLDVRLRLRYRPTVPLAILTIGISLLALTGYIYGVTSFYGLPGFIPMAFNTAIGFMLLGLAMFAARPKNEPVATLLSDSAGGVVARRLLPPAAILPIGFGWICLLGLHGHFDQMPYRLTFYSLLITVIFLTLTWWNARSLLNLDMRRRSAELTAVEEHHLLRSLIDNLPDMVFVKDTHHRFLLNNLAHAKTLGAATPEEMLGKTDLDYFKPEFSEQFRAEERQVVNTGVAIIDKEQHLTDGAGIARTVSIAKVPFRDTQGHIVGIVGIAHDISKRKQAEEERDRFFTLSADMICVAGFDGFFKRVNPAFENILGYSANELTSRPWTDFVHPDDLQTTVAEGKKLTTGAVTLSFENRYRCKDLSYRWLSWTAVPAVREGLIYAIARDTTERRQVEEQLRETNRRLEAAIASEVSAQQSLRTAQSTMVQTEKLAGLGQMVAGVAHEINNPLSFVSNNVAVLQRDLRGMMTLLELYRTASTLLELHNPNLFAEIQRVEQEIDLAYVVGNLQELLLRSRDGLKRIQQIVKDLRDFARLDESDLHEVNLNEGIQSTVTIVFGHAKKHGVYLKTELGDLPLVTCYPAKINQVVMNLITNAIDASKPESEVIIRTRDGGDGTVKIEVSDSGSGIDPAIRQRIFDPFFTTKAQGQGTGLGLSISYGIIRDHNGSIDVTSEIGKGSTFVVTLPVKGVARGDGKSKDPPDLHGVPSANTTLSH